MFIPGSVLPFVRPSRLASLAPQDEEGGARGERHQCPHAEVPRAAGPRSTHPLTTTISSRPRRGEIDLHFGEDVAHRVEGAAHVLRIEPADAADAERVGDRELARIDDVAARLKPVIDALED